MVSKTTRRVNGDARRKCPSWINEFVAHTEKIESPTIYRRWAAITAIGAVLRQHVWINPATILYPHLYTFLVGNPGIGKSRAISAVLKYVREIPEFPFGATSMTMASLVDLLEESKQNTKMELGSLREFNTLFIAPDELSAFMHEYDKALIAGLTAFYDVEPYHQTRRTKDLSVKINSPQLSILTGTATSSLIHLIPPGAWTQGFMSRVIMVYSEDKPMVDIFSSKPIDLSKELVEDIRTIGDKYLTCGEFLWTEAYANAMREWREKGLKPVPMHPKLESYVARRFAHLIKLTMIANVDRDGGLNLDLKDFMTAKGWLLEVEGVMEKVFETAAGGQDVDAIANIKHYLYAYGPAGTEEADVMRFASQQLRYAIHAQDVINMLISTGDFRIVRESYGKRRLASTKSFTSSEA